MTTNQSITETRKIDNRGYRGARRLVVVFEGPGAGHMLSGPSAPEVDGWKCHFVARHGADKVKYTYRPTQDVQADG